MASRDNLISEDWEDIGDDNLSVVSLPLSETESTKAQETPELGTSTSAPDTSLSAVKKQAETKSTSKSPNPHDPLDIYNGPDVNTGVGSSSRGVARGNKVTQKGAAEHLEDPFQDPPSDNISDGQGDEAGEATESVDEILESGSRDTDPVFLSKTHQSVCGIIEDTVRIVKGTPILGEELTNPSVNICMELRSQLSRIHPIIAGYVRTSKDEINIPLDSGLGEWLSAVRVKVLGLLAETQRLSREPVPQQSHRKPKVPWYVDVYGRRSDLERIWDELAEYKNRMHEFLPILQADFDDFHTQHLAFPATKSPPKYPSLHPSNVLGFQSFVDCGTHPQRQEKSAACQSPSAPINIPRRSLFYSASVPLPLPPPQPIPVPTDTTAKQPFDKDTSDRIWNLRRDLYLLKDALQHSLDRLHFTASNKHVALPLSEWAAVLGARYETLKSVVSTVVSNHASDWIDSIATGGLTFREFRALGDEPLNMFTAQLAEVVGRDGKFPELTRERDSFGNYTFPIHRAPKGPGLNGDELDVLDAVVDQLEVKFKVNVSAELS